MAGKLSVYSSNRVLNKLLRSTDFTPTASYWLALFTGSVDGTLRNNTLTGECPDANGYSRIEVRGGTAITFSVSTVGATENSAAIVFSPATGLWGTITYAALMDSATIGAGNVILYGALTAAKTVDNGDTMRINTGALDILL